MFGLADELYSSMRFAECYKLTSKYVNVLQLVTPELTSPCDQNPRRPLIASANAADPPRLHAPSPSSTLAALPPCA